jgi:membrane fusion protein, multidrug efflux system
MKTSHYLAIALAIGAIVWVASGQFGGESAPESTQTEPSPTAEQAAPAQVRVAPSTSQPYTVKLVVTGRTAASRELALRVETSGRIEEIAANEGDQLEEGALIVRLSDDDRNERLSRAQSLLEQRRIEAEASAELAESGWRAQTSDAGARAELQNARAELAAIQLDMARTEIAAPFAGALESIDVEIGDVVDVNTQIGTLYDLDPILVIAAVSEREVGYLTLGEAGSAKLITGATVDGTLRFIGKIAEPETRTFRIELEVPNPDLSLPAGLTADIEIPLATVPAHFVSPSVLSLADDGTLGIKIVDDDNIVRFMPVTVVADADDGIWIAGLPASITVITVGHDYVAAGQTVDPVLVEGSAFSQQP